MGVRDINPGAVLDAIKDGCDDIYKLAERFEVMHVSHTLRTTVHQLGSAGLVLVDRDNGCRLELL